MSNKCGIEKPKSGVNVFVRNNAGDIISEYVTDSDGALTQTGLVTPNTSR